MNSEYLTDYLSKIYNFNKSVIVERNNLQFLVKFDKYNNFWKSFNDGNWENETFKIFDDLIDEDSTYVDVGAWIGPTVLYASRIANKVYAFEPSKAFFTLQENVCLNSKSLLANEIKLFNNAVGLEDKTILLGASDSGNSMDSIFDTSNTYNVKQIDLFKFLKSENVFQDNLFIKIDIEGAEYSFAVEFFQLLKNQKNFKALISTHPLILFKSLRSKRSFIISVLNVVVAHYKILKFTTKYVYSEDLKEIKLPLYETLRSVYRFKAFIFSNHRIF